MVATATAAANGQSVGDVSVILPEALAAALQDSVGAAVTACNAVPAKLRRRNTGLLRKDADAGNALALSFANVCHDILINIESSFDLFTWTCYGRG